MNPMKISDLIAFLAQQQNELGDVPVFINVRGSGPRPITDNHGIHSIHYGSGVPEDLRPAAPFVELLNLPR